MSFIGKNYCYMKSSVGIDAPPNARHKSFCTWTLMSVAPEILASHSARLQSLHCHRLVPY